MQNLSSLVAAVDVADTVVDTKVAEAVEVSAEDLEALEEDEAVGVKRQKIKTEIFDYKTKPMILNKWEYANENNFFECFWRFWAKKIEKKRYIFFRL